MNVMSPAAFVIILMVPIVVNVKLDSSKISTIPKLVPVNKITKISLYFVINKELLSKFIC